MEETVLQFGTGKFLRSFADLFIHEANAAGREIGRVVAVQSTASDRGSWLNQQRGTYHVLIRGTVGGVEIDDIAAVASISRALVAKFEWDRALEVARSSHLRAIVSNVTEIGYRDDADGDALLDSPPGSFPAKLTAVLWARHRANLPGVTVLPCELIERNGDRRRELVLRVAERWQLGPEFLDWIERECQWANCLVDRIVTGPPQEHELLEGDRLMSVAEPFAFWAVELAGGVCPIEHKAVHVVDDVTPYALRKVRILNGAHTALACKALPLQFETVRQCVTDPEIGPWLEALVSEEIVPVLADRVGEDTTTFAAETFERFRNPFIEHELSAIAWEQEAKVQARLMPTYHEYRERFGKVPPMLHSILEQFIEKERSA